MTRAHEQPAPEGSLDGQAESAVGGLDREMEELWPGGMPEKERLLWDRLPPERKEQGVRRLNAVLNRHSLAAGVVRSGPAKDAAEAAGVGLSTYYAIEKRWREKPSLASLRIYVAGEDSASDERSERQSAAEKRRAELRERIQQELARHPGSTVTEIYEALGAESDRPSFGTVLRLMRTLRRNSSNRAPFGRHIIFDSAGLDAIDDAGQRLRLCVALDRGTELILGWDIKPDRSVLLGYRFAANHARFWLQDLEMSPGPPAWGTPEVLEVRLAPQDCPSGRALHLDRARPAVQVDSTSRLGRAVIDVLGERIGGVWLGLGTAKAGHSYRSGRPVLMPLLNLGLRSAIGSAIQQYNEARLKAFDKPTGNVPPQVLAELADVFEDFMERIIPDPTSNLRDGRE